MDDRQLLDEFIAHRSETAFRVISDQYLNLVYSTAFRETGDPHLAQDVTQAVFILLARKADSLPKNVLLAGWLYRTTHFVASRAQRNEQRRQRREQEAFQMQQNLSADDTWKNVAPLLDEALSGLRETDRVAILLRFFQNEPLGKVGDALGVSEEAAGKRVARALEKLRGYFSRRGFAVTGTALGATLASHSAHAAPAQLSQNVITAVFLHAPSSAAAHYVMVQETLRAWQRMKAKLLLGFGSAAIMAVFLIVHSISIADSARPMAASLAKIQPSAPASVKNDNGENDPLQIGNGAVAATLPNFPVLKFQAVDGETGKGLAGARVLALSLLDPHQIDLKTNLATDSEGRCDVPLAYTNCLGIAVGVIADGYEQRCVIAGVNEPIPTSWVLKLHRGGTIGGVVQDEAGRPVPNANIMVQFFGTGDSSAREYQRERPGFMADDLAVATTDAFGRWQFHSAPQTNGDFFINVRHPEFPAVSFQTDADSRSYVEPNRVELALLHDSRAVLVLKGGLGLSGVVTDEQQKPIADARVQFGENFDDKHSTAVTDGKGAFALTNLKPGNGHITITAKNFAPERLPVTVANDSKPVTVQLKPGALLRIRVVDENSNAMPGVDVRLQDWRGNNTLEWGGATDDDGRISWDSAPVDQLDMYAGKLGYFSSRRNFFTADGEEHVITMRKELTVTGWALDAATGQAITEFKAIPGAERHDLVHGTNGQYSVTFREFNPPFHVIIEAEGYESLTSDPISARTNPAVWNAELKRPDPQQTITGTILLPDGTPAVGAQVALCAGAGSVVVGQGKFINYGDSGINNADENGRFAFPPEQTASLLVAIHPRGFASVNVARVGKPLTVQLQSWGRIEGSLKIRGETNSGRNVVLSSAQNGAGINFDLGSFTTKSDDAGNFVFDQAPPGAATLFISDGLGIPFSHQTPVLVQPGGTVQAQIGGSGSAIKGKFVLSDPTRSIDWPRRVWTANIGTAPSPLAVPTNLTADQRVAWLRKYDASEEGMARARNSRSFPLNVAEDGSFSAVDVPPGDYSLSVMFTKEPVDRSNFTGGLRAILASTRQEITVPDFQDAKEVDLGTVTVKMR